MSCSPCEIRRRAFVLVVLVLSCSVLVYSQEHQQQNREVLQERANSFSVYGGMGVKLAAAPQLINYINTIADPSQAASQFATDIEFFGGVEFPVTEEWGGAVEYGYLFKSYTLPTANAGTYTVFYNFHMPTAMVQYVIPGKGYFVKFGAGAGYHSGSLQQTNSIFSTDSTYTCHGIGFKLEGVGQTAFDEHLYGYISGDMRWEFMGEPKNSRGNTLENRGQSASLSMFVVGISFGLIYYF